LFELRVTTSCCPSGAASNASWRIAAKAGTMGTSRRRCFSYRSVFGASTESRLRSESTSHHVNRCVPDGQRKPAYWHTPNKVRQAMLGQAARFFVASSGGTYRVRSAAIAPVFSRRNGFAPISPRSSACLNAVFALRDCLRIVASDCVFSATSHARQSAAPSTVTASIGSPAAEKLGE
jgi:hypothetical protein